MRSLTIGEIESVINYWRPREVSGEDGARSVPGRAFSFMYRSGDPSAHRIG
ncbi:DUF3717 domain-containing protein [Paraburkholderia heleia]|uniref:DUF3717 domain-containing protein n=1 Tax=Paraburkholderia heleia TaxID=634127 RepID=UPI0038BDA256